MRLLTNECALIESCGEQAWLKTPNEEADVVETVSKQKVPERKGVFVYLYEISNCFEDQLLGGFEVVSKQKEKGKEKKWWN